MTSRSKNVVWFLMNTCIIAYKVYSLSYRSTDSTNTLYPGYTQTQLVTLRCWTSELQKPCASSKSDVLRFWRASGASLALRPDRNDCRIWCTNCLWERSQIVQPTRNETRQGTVREQSLLSRNIWVCGINKIWWKAVERKILKYL